MEVKDIQYPYLRGKRVEVFNDPITRQDKEGDARITTIPVYDGTADDRVFVRASVKFKGDHNAVPRVFRVDDIMD